MSLDILRLKALRVSHNKTQEDIALLLNITRAAYTNIELGKREPDLKTISILADTFVVSVDYLLGRTDIRNIDDISDIQITPEEDDLLQCYRTSSNDDKNVIWAVLNKYKKQEKRKKEAT